MFPEIYNSWLVDNALRLVSWKLEISNLYHRKRASLYLTVVLIYEMECLNKVVAAENRSSFDLDSEQCRSNIHYYLRPLLSEFNKQLFVRRQV